jgi:hypothetical protein
METEIRDPFIIHPQTKYPDGVLLLFQVPEEWDEYECETVIDLTECFIKKRFPNLDVLECSAHCGWGRAVLMGRGLKREHAQHKGINPLVILR